MFSDILLRLEWRRAVKINTSVPDFLASRGLSGTRTSQVPRSPDPVCAATYIKLLTSFDGWGISIKSPGVLFLFIRFLRQNHPPPNPGQYTVNDRYSTWPLS